MARAKKMTRLQEQQERAQQEWEANLDMLKRIRDDTDSKPGERLAAIKELKEMGFDKSPSREPEPDLSQMHMLLIGIPSLDMLRKVVMNKLEDDKQPARRADLVGTQ